MTGESGGAQVKGWIARIGGGGLAAIAAVLLAGGIIGYRLIGSLPVAEQSEGQSAEYWQQQGLTLFQQEHYAEAADAYRRATDADPDSAVLWSSLGEALVMASERDPMPPAALEAFRKAIALDRKDPRARYFLAVEKDLAGDHESAIADWLALLADTPPGAPWETDLKRQAIVDSWPEDVDDQAARRDWGFAPVYDFPRAFDEYLIPSIRERYR